MSAAIEPRYARQVALPVIGEAGQRRLAQSKVLILGLGGLGCPAALYLASCGVGRLLLCDHDRVDASNLARQILFNQQDIDKPKVTVAARALHSLNPKLIIDTLESRMTAETLLPLVADCSVVLDASDNYATRLAVNQACLTASRPWVMGASIRTEGQLLALTPGRDNTPCYLCVYGEASRSLDDCQGSGVLASVTGMVGTAMANEALRLLLKPDCVHPTLHLLDAWTMDWRQVRVKPRADCPAC